MKREICNFWQFLDRKSPPFGIFSENSSILVRAGLPKSGGKSVCFRFWETSKGVCIVPCTVYTIQAQHVQYVLCTVPKYYTVNIVPFQHCTRKTVLHSNIFKQQQYWITTSTKGKTSIKRGFSLAIAVLGIQQYRCGVLS